MSDLQYLRSLDKIVLPEEFTYFNHSTCYLPNEIKQKMVNGKYAKGWPLVPLDGFTVEREMSFVERNERINDCLRYQNPLSQAPTIYQLYDYSKPFMIRVVMPKKSIITEHSQDESYTKELQQIYSGLGDGRHEKLPNKTKVLTFASTQVDEISGKKVDILYCVREKDLKWYTSLVRERLAQGSPKQFELPEEIDRRSSFDFLTGDLLLDKDFDFSRYIGNDGDMSEFEQEYYDVFSSMIEKNLDNGALNSLSWEDRSAVHTMFENTYATEKSKKR